MEFIPTAEQDRIIEAVKTGENVVVTAVAGSGKTSTLRLIGDALAPQRGLYLAFGKDIQTEAEKTFPDNVEARTAHSLAWWYVKDDAAHAHMINRMDADPKPWDVWKRLAIPGVLTFEDNGESRAFANKNLMSVANATVSRFCRSADAELTTHHVPREFENITDQGIFARAILPIAQRLWADLTSPTGIVKVTGDHTLKVWSLARPALNADFILFDEAQDADPAIAHVIEGQTVQVVMVGDASQAIYGWRGAIDALSRFAARPGVISRKLTRSFRFGPAIAELANRFLDHLGAEVRIVGNEAKNSTVAILDHADAILCRTNAGVIEYAIDMLAAGKRVAIAGGTKELISFIRAADKLMKIERGEAKGFVTHSELGAFNTWSDVVAHAGTEDGSDIRIKVNLVQTYGADYLMEVLEQLVDIKSAKPGSYDVVISTAHKAKGLEWGSVKIGNDWKLPTEEGELPSPADLMLMYVALTRAMITVDPGILAGV